MANKMKKNGEKQFLKTFKIIWNKIILFILKNAPKINFFEIEYIYMNLILSTKNICNNKIIMNYIFIKFK